MDLESRATKEEKLSSKFESKIFIDINTCFFTDSIPWLAEKKLGNNFIPILNLGYLISLYVKKKHSLCLPIRMYLFFKAFKSLLHQLILLNQRYKFH
jgi:hypothetical protein